MESTADMSTNESLSLERSEHKETGEMAEMVRTAEREKAAQTAGDGVAETRPQEGQNTGINAETMAVNETSPGTKEDETTKQPEESAAETRAEDRPAGAKRATTQINEDNTDSHEVETASYVTDTPSREQEMVSQDQEPASGAQNMAIAPLQAVGENLAAGQEGEEETVGTVIIEETAPSEPIETSETMDNGDASNFDKSEEGENHGEPENAVTDGEKKEQDVAMGGGNERGLEPYVHSDVYEADYGEMDGEGDGGLDKKDSDMGDDAKRDSNRREDKEDADEDGNADGGVEKMGMSRSPREAEEKAWRLRREIRTLVQARQAAREKLRKLQSSLRAEERQQEAANQKDDDKEADKRDEETTSREEDTERQEADTERRTGADGNDEEQKDDEEMGSASRKRAKPVDEVSKSDGASACVRTQCRIYMKHALYDSQEVEEKPVDKRVG